MNMEFHYSSDTKPECPSMAYESDAKECLSETPFASLENELTIWTRKEKEDFWSVIEVHIVNLLGEIMTMVVSPILHMCLDLDPNDMNDYKYCKRLVGKYASAFKCRQDLIFAPRR